MNLRKIPLKKWMDSAVVFFMGLITLLALVFPLQKGGDKFGIYKYQECGFDLFDFNSIARPENLEWLTIIVAVFCIIQLLASIFVMIFAVINLFSNSFGKAIAISRFMCIVFCFVYAIMGIILNAVYLSNKNGLWLDDYGYLGVLGVDKEFVSVYTLSYVPFILVIVIWGLYLLIKEYLLHPNKMSEQKSLNTKLSDINMSKNTIISEKNLQQNKEENNNQISICELEKQEEIIGQLKDSIEGLKSYKELLDSGVITQQEFDELKKRILKL